MSDNTIVRYGGIAGILGLVIGLGAAVLPSFTNAFILVALVLLAVMAFALYRLYRSQEPTLSTVGLVIAVGVPVVLVVSMLLPNMPANFGGLVMGLSFFLLPLIFGFLAYRHNKGGMSRTLATIGIAAGVAGIVNFVVVLAGGGDYANPNNPALSPLIMGSYYLAALLGMVWIVWTGVELFRGKMVTA